MTRLLVLFFALLLPIQFAWSAASAYCEHEPVSSSQASHFGHHAHEHDGDSKPVAKLAADTDCASCHAASTPAIPTALDQRAVAAPTAFTARLLQPAFSSALARAPDRPQWLRLV